MRLVDADALVNRIRQEPTDGMYTEEIVAAIDEQPTIEAAPVVHGRWVHVPSSDMMTGKAYKCSECGRMRYGSYMPNYCPNCGARMDGDGDA